MERCRGSEALDIPPPQELVSSFLIYPPIMAQWCARGWRALEWISRSPSTHLYKFAKNRFTSSRTQKTPGAPPRPCRQPATQSRAVGALWGGAGAYQPTYPAPRPNHLFCTRPTHRDLTPRDPPRSKSSPVCSNGPTLHRAAGQRRERPNHISSCSILRVISVKCREFRTFL